MTDTRSAMVRAIAAIVLTLAVMLTGIGRGLALASHDAMATVSIAGIATPICHHDPRDASGPPDGARHDCCDACALLAAATLPGRLNVPAPVAPAYRAEHAQAVAWVPASSRLRTPRQAQGPPTA